MSEKVLDLRNVVELQNQLMRYLKEEESKETPNEQKIDDICDQLDELCIEYDLLVN